MRRIEHHGVNFRQRIGADRLAHQIAMLNLDKGTTNGLQWGAINYAKTGGGLQLALLNYAEEMKGVQVGAVNIIKKGGMFPVMIIANWGKK